jgi:hypothetical protein
VSGPVLRRPKGFDAIVETFGDPRKYLRADGGPSPTWERRILDFVPLPRPLPLAWDGARNATKVRCHKLIAEPLAAAFRIVEDAGLWEELRDYGGCYAWRSQRGGAGKLSTHCWGIAIDVDVNRNPLGEEPEIHAGVVQAFEAAGFYWGGRFGRPDGMHFQLAENY